MDTRTADVDVSAQIEVIKRDMPETYANIQDKAKTKGNQVYVWVRQGLRGHPDCFFATEGGRDVGTPFKRPGIMAQLQEYERLYGPVTIAVFADEGVF